MHTRSGRALTPLLANALAAVAGAQIEPLVAVDELHAYAPDASTYDFFGSSVALSDDALAALGIRPPGVPGVAYLYARQDDSWTGPTLIQVGELRDPDLPHEELSMRAERLVVGAPSGGVGSPGGWGDVFRRARGSWSREASLQPRSRVPDQRFGRTVSMSPTQDCIAVGACMDDDRLEDAGAVYVYRLVDGAWAEEQKLFAGDASSWAGFGRSVALDGALLAVTAWGADAIYFFEYDGASWIEWQRFKAIPSTGASALQGDVAVFGGQGSAIVFERTWGVWSQVQVLESPSSPEDLFGMSVDLDDDRIAVGSGRSFSSDPRDPGACYLYERDDGNTWQLGTVVEAHDGAARDAFGHSVSLRDGRLAVGAPRDDERGTDSGSVYVYSVLDRVGTSFCHGDGSGATCPCTNPSPPGNGEGCAHSQDGGAILVASGSARVAEDDLVLHARRMPPGSLTVLVAGTQAGGGVLGDGLACVGGQTLRVGPARAADGSGRINWGPYLGLAGAGQTLHFQCWYRSASSPCGTHINGSNGVQVTFTP